MSLTTRCCCCELPKIRPVTAIMAIAIGTTDTRMFQAIAEVRKRRLSLRTFSAYAFHRGCASQTLSTHPDITYPPDRASPRLPHHCCMQHACQGNGPRTGPRHT